jgi:short-subunit dehydrogenase involved in D-alanine esterification of teichoic acids
MAPVSTLSFKCALITGGGGGLGRAMADSLIAMGKSVIIAGRIEARLKKTAAEIGAKAYFVVDLSNIPAISSFVKDIVSKYPELGCLINSAGVLRPFQITSPDYDFDLTRADQEIDTNIRGPLHLNVSLVPHFNSLPNGGVIMNVSSVLGYNPFSLVNPAAGLGYELVEKWYSAYGEAYTKAGG